MGHLEEANLTYRKHFVQSMDISFKCLVASMKLFIHSFIPDIFSRAGSDLASYISKLTKLKGKKSLKNITR